MALLTVMAYGFNSCNGFMAVITVNSEFAKCYELSVIPYMLDTAEVNVYEWP